MYISVIFQGAQLLNPSSPLCHVTCKSGETFTIHCGIKAQLIEVNENLVQNPDLITRKVGVSLLN